jgi:hypothetical protein
MAETDTSAHWLAHYFGIARYQWIFAAWLGLFASGFLLIFQPFGVNNFDPTFRVRPEFLIAVLSIGLVVTGTVVVNEFLIRPKVLPSLDRWRVIAWLGWTFLLLDTSLFLFYNYLGNWHDFRLASYFGFIRDVSLLLAMPVVMFLFYLRQESLKSEFVQLQSIHLGSPASRMVQIDSENSKDQLTIALDALLYLESQDNYVAVTWMENGAEKSRLIRSSLKRLEDLLDEPLLLRCHRSFIVNLGRVRSCQGNRHGLKLKLEGSDRRLPVSRAYTEAVLNRLGPNPQP